MNPNFIPSGDDFPEPHMEQRERNARFDRLIMVAAGCTPFAVLALVLWAALG